MASLKELRAQVEAMEAQAAKELEQKQRAEKQRMNDILAAADEIMERAVKELIHLYPEVIYSAGIVGGKAKYHVEKALGKRNEKIKIL